MPYSIVKWENTKKEVEMDFLHEFSEKISKSWFAYLLFGLFLALLVAVAAYLFGTPPIP